MKILIIEDDKEISEALKEGLEDESYAVDTCLDGEEGYRTAAADEYDLIILDVMLPSMNGFEVCKKLRAVFQRGSAVSAFPLATSTHSCWTACSPVFGIVSCFVLPFLVGVQDPISALSDKYVDIFPRVDFLFRLFDLFKIVFCFIVSLQGFFVDFGPSVL